MLQALIGPVTGLLDKFVEDKEYEFENEKSLDMNEKAGSVL